MKRILFTALVLVLALSALSAQAAVEKKEYKKEIDLMGMYKFTDPEGVDYDQRTVLYMPVLEGADEYSLGARHMFVIFYGKENKGLRIYNIFVNETEEQAKAMLKGMEGKEKADGKVYWSYSDETFFQMMEAFIPELSTWINNLMSSGMIELEQK